MLTRSLFGETWYLYLAIIEQAVNFVLIRNPNSNQSHVYFISEALTETKAQYQNIEKASLALVTESHNLRRNLTKWAIELSKFEVSFKARKILKAYLFIDFLAKITFIPPKQDCSRVMLMNG
ncbi:hypothetical protein KIW84_011663 [Lathyrus oleraceus]|uniref:Reverse transcriptase RNase H-like domain-containing protein n=1 Tax=Pisum sativum TaxID=3888 RepID=A0A9D5GV02_PEA|nr:hypothetical protein KIW84_011663 [Pisum sativum]